MLAQGCAVGFLCAGASLTGDDLWSLEVLVGMEVAGRQSKPQPDEHKKEISAPPHDGLAIFVLGRAAQTFDWIHRRV